MNGKAVLACLIALGLRGAVAADVSEVSFETSDGVTIAASCYLPDNRPAPACVLIHMLRKTRDSWAEFAEKAQESGFVVLSFDLRGHGQSTLSKSGPVRESSFSEPDFAAMTFDVAAAVAWLRRRTDVDTVCIVLMGASIGANVALNYAKEDGAVAGVILVSPGESYRGLQCFPAFHAYGARPALVIAAEDDDYSLVTIRKLEALASPACTFRVLPEGGHGTYLFQSHPELADMVLDFLSSLRRK